MSSHVRTFSASRLRPAAGLPGALRQWHPVASLALPAAAALFLAATVALNIAYADRVTAGVRVMGVDMGGRSRAEARALADAEIERVLQRPVTLRLQGQEWTLPAGDLGITLDPNAMVDEAFAIGREGNILQRVAAQWGALVLGERLRGPALQFEPERELPQLGKIATTVNRPVRDARVEVSPADFSVSLIAEEAGIEMLLIESGNRLRQAVSAGLPARVDLAFETREPAIAAADVQAARAQAERMVAGPLSLTYGDRRWTLSREDIARLLAFERVPGQPVQALINPDTARAVLDRIAREVEQPAVNARFELAGGGLRVVREGQDGRTLDHAALPGLIRQRLLSDDRTLALPVATSRPAVASGDGPRLGITQLVREGRTGFPGAVPEKQHNIRLASSRLHGVVVPPGALFSFNDEVGPTTLDAGYRVGWGITSGGGGAPPKTVPSVAGGICQVATTLFQPVFHAGYAIEERHWHLYWINAYGQAPLGMRGLDATVDEEAGLDFKFINNTPDHLLIQSRVEGSTLIFGLYGTKPSWDVTIDGPAITNVVAANREPVTQPEPSMPAGRSLAVEAAQDGFVATIVRTVKQGDDVRTLRLRSGYGPSRNVTLIGTGPA